MPIHCTDLTNIIYHIISKNIDTNVIECVGPETLSFKEILEKIFKTYKKKIFNSFPFTLCKNICLYFRKITKAFINIRSIKIT